MASDGDASSPSTIRDLLVALPNGDYRYKHAEAPTRDLEYDELARVVEAARSLNFYERVRPWDELFRKRFPAVYALRGWEVCRGEWRVGVHPLREG